MKPSHLIEFDALSPTAVRIEISDDPAPEPTQAVTDRWNAMRTVNPRLFNGPVLSFVDFVPNTVRARRDSYERLAVQEHEPDTVWPPVMQLSVTGLVTALDDDGTRHVLVGKRSHATRIYGGLWELGPSGGIDPPPLSHKAFDGLDVFRQLVQEMREETGLPADPDPGPIIAITVDDVATSADLVMRIDLARPLDEIIAHTRRVHEDGWEYETTRWVPCDQFGSFVVQQPCIPPTVALARLVESL